jgi:hypothetical protein
VSLDGVMQAPGGPEEDPTGGLLGRKTYDIFAAHWPYVQKDPKASGVDALNVEIARRFNAITKYVATHRHESLTRAGEVKTGSFAMEQPTAAEIERRRNVK